MRPEYQMQKLKIERERRARETDEQLKQLEEQKTLVMLKLKINGDESDELRPESLEKPINPNSGGFLAISAAVTRKAIQAKTEDFFKHRLTINKTQTMLQLISAEIQ